MVVAFTLFHLTKQLLSKSPRRVLPLQASTGHFARQLLKQLVGGALDLVVVFGTGALFGGYEGAAM
jgi:hypothetical protein